MNIETLKKNDKKKIIMVITFIVLALVVLIFSVSLAKYRNTKSISIAKGTVNYKQADLNLVSVYLEDEDDNYKQSSDGKIPTTGYTLNEDITKTRCEIKGVTDTNIKITYENGEVSFSKLTTAGTKCYLYFDKIKDTEVPVIKIHETRNIKKTSMTLYITASDNSGIAGYYFKLSTSDDWGEADCVNKTYCLHSVTGLTADTNYTFDVKACDASGNCSTTTITQQTKPSGTPIPAGTTSSTLLNYSINKQSGTPDFSKVDGDGLYTWTNGDYSGGSQTIKYFRGNDVYNWVVFGKDGSKYIWWHIIRNNSNGSLRMIYVGLSDSKTIAPATTGDGTHIGINTFNAGNSDNANDNKYLGFKYTTGQVHGTGTNSTILGDENSTDKKTLYGWYNATLKTNTNYSGKIEVNSGFCNDRQPSTSKTELNGSGGVASDSTYFGAYIRLITNNSPSLLCPGSGDIFKVPVGLITADELVMGGMVTDDDAWRNSDAYRKGAYPFLYTNKQYWTMSPFSTVGTYFSPSLFAGSSLISTPRTDSKNSIGVRPVINLKSNTQFEQGGTGEADSPYVVSGT